MLVFRNGILTYPQGGTQRLDQDGNPVTASTAEQSVECYINTSSENRNGRYDDGQFKNATYNVLVDMDSVEDGFNPKRISLRHEQKGDLGAFPVQRIGFYTITRSIELWV